MFDFVRSHSKLMLGLMVLLIFPSFVFFGVQGYSRYMEEGARDVAKVDGRGITRAEWDNAHKRNIERMRNQMPGVDVKLLDTPEMKRQTLDGLVRDRVLLVAADKLVLAPGDERLERLFKTDPQFAPFRNVDGSVNKAILAAQGMSSASFAQSLRQELAMKQVLGSVVGTAFSPASAASAALGALMQRREVQLQRFELAKYMAKVAPTDAEIEAYHKSHENEFKAPEQAQIEYVMLDLETIAKGIEVPDKDLQDYYAQNASRYTTAEERRASHILVKTEPSMSSADKAKAKARAEELLAEVRKNPKSFADVARKASQDPGSAERGGDLDWNGRGAMVKSFDDAMFAMKEGEISNVVETDFGYHVIQLTGVRGGSKRPFAEVRAEITAEVRKSLAQRRFAEEAEKFTTIVYEQPDSLQPVIDKLKLEKKTATVLREPAPGATGPLASPKLLAAVFGTDAVKNKRNTEAVEVGANQLVSARIVQHQPARVQPLAEVKDQVRQRVVVEEAAALARKDGAAALATAKAKPADALPDTVTISRAQLHGLPRQVIDAALRADPTALPAIQGVDVPQWGYAVVKVQRVLPHEAAPGGDAPLVSQYGQAWGAAEAEAYLEALKKRYGASFKEAAVAAAAAASAATP